MRKRLILIPAGLASLHAHWHSFKERSWDVWVIAYDGPSKAAQAADKTIFAKGPKWQLVSDALVQNPQWQEQYQSIWIPDDDIFMAPREVEKMFTQFEALKWKIAQPALSADSYFSHPITLVRRRCQWRKTNFVENMVPLFSKEALIEAAPTFLETRSGWGIDVIWSQKLFPNQIGILDAVPIAHTRPLGIVARGVAAPESFYAKLGVDPYEELNGVIAKYPLTQKYRVTQMKMRLGISLFGGLADWVSRRMKPRQK